MTRRPCGPQHRGVRAPRSILVARTLAATLAAATVITACGGGDELPAVDDPTSPRLEVHATEMAFDPGEIAVPAGRVEVVLHNDGTVLHDLRIDEQPFIVEAGPGETVAAATVLDKGRYRLFCSLPGHRESGMEGVVEVR
jgi:uncharacterized cupredoxin-like copper-binding protein